MTRAAARRARAIQTGGVMSKRAVVLITGIARCIRCWFVIFIGFGGIAEFLRLLCLYGDLRFDGHLPRFGGDGIILTGRI